MKKVEVKEVNTKRGLDDFVHFPARLYVGNPYYVPVCGSVIIMLWRLFF